MRSAIVLEDALKQESCFTSGVWFVDHGDSSLYGDLDSVQVHESKLSKANSITLCYKSSLMWGGESSRASRSFDVSILVTWSALHDHFCLLCFVASSIPTSQFVSSVDFGHTAPRLLGAYLFVLRKESLAE